MRIKFTKDYTTKEAKPHSFKKDQVETFADDEVGRASAQHFINRGAAEELTDENKRSAGEKSANRLVPDAPEAAPQAATSFPTGKKNV